MKEINRQLGTTFIFSTHDRRVMSMADRLIRIEDGRVAMLGVKVNDHWKLARPGNRNSNQKRVET